MKLVILDRDGVINEDSDQFVKSAEEWIPIPGSIEAIAALSQAGFTIAIATNQSGLGRGLFASDDLEAMHQKLTQLVAEAGGEIHAIFFCPHHPDEGCNCRKPSSGMIESIGETFGCSLAEVPVIGDSLRDLQCGLDLGCKPILVRTGKGEGTLQKLHSQPDPRLSLDSLLVVNDLSEAAQLIIRGEV